MYTATQHQLPCRDGLFGRRRQSSLFDPMSYSIEVYGGKSFATDSMNGKQHNSLSDEDKTRHSSTHELVKPFLGKSFEMVV